MRTLLLLLSLTVSVSASAADGDERSPNILLIIGDDMGSESLSCYGWSNDTAKTPMLDDLCNNGVRFDNFWSQAACSPTRAAMLTGRYAVRTGVGRPTGDNAAMGYFPEILPKPATAPAEPERARHGQDPDTPGHYGPMLNEFMLPMAFKVNPELGYSTAAIGKWHLADNRNGWEHHPNIIGFDHYAGLIRGFPDSYFTWNKVVNGKWSQETGYAPEDKTDDAIEWIESQGDDPWFLWMAFNLPHTPLHVPPQHLWRSDWSHLDPSATPELDNVDYFHAMLEAMDSEIERLLGSMPPDVRDNTYVIFVADNGTGNGSVSPPVVEGRGKGGMYQGGLNVPLFVTGPGVATGESDALVNASDMFLTILDLAGIDASETVPENAVLDSISFAPYLADPSLDSKRQFAYADAFFNNFAGIPDANYAVRNERYKFMRMQGEFALYDLSVDPFEKNNLLEQELDDEQQAQYKSLQAIASEIRSGR
jgi:arylsulfatase A-like enzyme